MKLIETKIKDLYILEPRVFGDDRGYFFESFNSQTFQELIGEEVEFVQDNQSMSGENIVRGLHFQNPPFAQGKLVRVIKGEVIDVAVDIRKDSPTYGEHVSVRLSGENNRMFWIPPGFAHGFSSLEEGTIFSYKCTNYYSKESEGSVAWDDPELNINWGVENPIISEKDQESPLFRDLKSKF
ncbi:MAG: dTDP-4-dehydrorhamnose 3,5-epimerase [Urechidicola sp.]|jgi:dTDP-4-dehydrorhamnose 3,5-epimerase|tara:strand:- start:409 stop:954 length:546 start_codon:yes stop_codon:yes gene_type:complete